MAILDPEVDDILREATAPLLVERYADGAVEPAGAATTVWRHALRRLLAADVIGLAIAAFLGPLLVSSISDNPQSAPGHVWSVYAFNLAMIPLFVAVFAVYGLYRGITRRISKSVFADLGNILHGLMISGFLYAIIGYGAKVSLHYQALSVAKIVAMCLFALVTVPLCRAVAFGLLGRSGYATVPVIVVGTGKLAQTVASHLRRALERRLRRVRRRQSARAA